MGKRSHIAKAISKIMLYLLTSTSLLWTYPYPEEMLTFTENKEEGCIPAHLYALIEASPESKEGNEYNSPHALFYQLYENTKKLLLLG